MPAAANIDYSSVLRLTSVAMDIIANQLCGNRRPATRQMNWDHARVFLAVARSGQILAAAKMLGLNHATVSRQIAALERQLKTNLLERRANGSVLTAAGKQFAAAIERAESELLRAQADLTRAELTLSGTVRVGTPEALGNFFLAPELVNFAADHENLTIQLVAMPRKFSLSNREADIAITLERPTHGHLIVQKLIDFTLGVYASEEYLRRTGPIEVPDDLTDRIFVTNINDLAFSRALDYADVVRKLIPRCFECISVTGQMEAISAGVGVGLLHEYAATKYAHLRRVCPELSFERTYWLMRHPDTYNTRAIAATADFITRRLREERSLFHRSFFKETG